MMLVVMLLIRALGWLFDAMLSAVPQVSSPKTCLNMLCRKYI